LEILMDAQDAIDFGGGVMVDPSQHEIIDTRGDSSFLGYLRRTLRRDSLFMYRHRKWGTYVLCEWLSRPGMGTTYGVMQEIEVMQGNPDWYTDPAPIPHMPSLLLRFNTPAVEALQSMVSWRKAQAREALVKQSEETDYRKELVASARRNGEYDEARLIEAGALDYSSPDVTRDETRVYEQAIKERTRCTVRVP
jgi:hypothetical protein